jgi:molecular chaperone DnaK (HSP70)
LDIPKNFPRIYEFSKYSSVECINFDNKYEKEKNELQNSESTEMESIVHILESKIKKEKEFGELMETRLKKSQKFLEETENFIKNHPNEKLTLPEMNIEKFFKRRVPK